MNVTVDAEPFDTADAQRLIAALDAGLANDYEPDQMFGRNLRAEQLAPGFGTFLVARADGTAVGCGAIRRLDPTTVEVKRMFVDPGLRGLGIAKKILEQLEDNARALGARRMVLETGIYQTAAIGLYSAAGFKPIDCFGEYVGSSTSLCFEKQL